MATEKEFAGVPDEKEKKKLDAQIKSADMSEDMQQEAVEVATDAMNKFNIEKDIAQYIKKEVITIQAPDFSSLQHRGVLLRVTLTFAQFDSRRGATWHCIVGRNFGSFVTHETKHFIYFYLGHCAILLFKTQ